MYVPQEVCIILRQYLCDFDYFCLMNTSKHIYGEIKKETMFFTLRVPDAKNFLCDSSFRDLILSKMKSPVNQLRLHFSDAQYLSPYMSPVPGLNVYEVIADHYQMLVKSKFQFQSVQSFIANTMQNVSFDGKFVTRKLNIFTTTMTSSEVHLTNFDHLSEVHFRGIKNVDVYALRNVHKLILSNCDRVCDVSCLNQVSDLTIQRCPGVVDISPLTNVKRLAILDCQNINDYDPLIHSKSLRIGLHFIGGKNLLNFSYLYELSGNNRMINCLINYQGIQRFIFSYHTGVDPNSFDFRLLSNIPYVEIIFGGDAETLSIEGLGGNHQEVTLYMNEVNIIGLECLKNVPKVSLSGCTDVFSLENIVDEVKYLEISDFHNLKTLTGITNRTKHFSFLGMNKVESYEGVEQVKELTLNHLTYRMGLPGLGPTFDKLVIKFPPFHPLPDPSPWDNCVTIPKAMERIEADLPTIDWLAAYYTCEKSKFRITFLKKRDY
jgi:hypothetical protein